MYVLHSLFQYIVYEYTINDNKYQNFRMIWCPKNVENLTGQYKFYRNVFVLRQIVVAFYFCDPCIQKMTGAPAVYRRAGYDE